MDEFEQLQRLRELWSRSIETWGQIVIPLGAAIVAYFLTLAADHCWDPCLLFVGWVVLAFCLAFWRLNVRHIDRQIVGLYPAMLRLEQERRWETQTRYYFNNLRWESLLFLGQQLGLTEQDTRARLEGNYEYFRIEARGHHHSLLRWVWDTRGYESVGDRGHRWQNGLVIGLLLFFLIPISWLFFVKGVTPTLEVTRWVVALVFASLGIPCGTP